ncbi:uncharacterized protein At5g65660-like isoform X1 [Zingiber officinale]|uniref:uncharacterized protein At5g65660-like isoform X1 n=1 Tax=Zingiber officinale TaxID=94328 RepID=UPI001C4D0951|nr:uncharacterized protein At5g65660-like isoform X1 [Zingiber officinale]
MDGGAAMPAAQPAAAAAEHHGSRPTLGFPLGTALLLVVIFCLSGFFALCYHWEKLRSLRGRPSRGHQQQLPPLDALEEGSRIPQPSSPSLTSKLSPMHQANKEEKVESLVVVMPGDKIAKFMAWPCPCQHRSPIADAFTASTVTREAAISPPS